MSLAASASLAIAPAAPLEILADSLVKASYPAMAMMDLVLLLLLGQGALGPDQEDPPALGVVSISVTSAHASCSGISWG